MPGGNKGQNYKRPNRDQFRKKTNQERNTKFGPSKNSALDVEEHSARDILKTVGQWERHAKTVAIQISSIKCAIWNKSTRLQKKIQVHGKSVI